jgi:hypothetical protein
MQGMVVRTILSGQEGGRPIGRCEMDFAICIHAAKLACNWEKLTL